MKRLVAGAAALLAAIAVLAPASPLAGSAGAAALPNGFQDEVLFEGLKEPTSFRFAADGRAFVAQKNGEIFVYPDGAGPGATPTLFADLRKEVYDNGDHGLLGLALDPDFEAGRPYVYALYSYDHELGSAAEPPRWGKGPSYEGDFCPHREVGEPGPGGEIGCLVSGRLVRMEVGAGDHAVPSAAAPDEHQLLEGWCQQSTTHSIGDLQFGPEGALFVSGGEGAMFSGGADWGQYGNPCGDPPDPAGTDLDPETGEGGSLRSQSLLRPAGQPVLLNGTLLRIDPDTGKGWPGNPRAASADENARRILGIGFRNPYRFTINPRTGAAFVNNVGNGQTEEIDRVPIGSPDVYNSGWPCYEGLVKNYQFKDLGNVVCEGLYGQPEAVQEPFFHYQHSTAVGPGDPCPIEEGSAITGSAFYEGSAYPAEYDDALFFSDAVRGCIYVMFADEDGEPDPQNVIPFLSETDNYPGVDIEQGPGGEMYYASLYAGTINRIAYDPGAPRAELKVADGSQPWGPTDLFVEFDAGESSSAEGHQLKFRWDLDGDGEFDDGEDRPLETETYKIAVNVDVGVQVEDTVTHKTSVAKLTVYPGDSPPKVTIAEPPGGLTWAVGQEVEFSGSAKANGGNGPTISPEDGLYWKVRLLHCPGGPTQCHEHPLQVFPGVGSGSLLAPDHDFPAYLHFILTATDDRGLSGQAEVKVAARPAILHMQSSPPGIPLNVGLGQGTTPFDFVAIEDSLTTVAAPATAEIDGVTWEFDRWSDGGDRVHSISAAGEETLTAIYRGPEGEEPGGEEPGGEEPKGPGGEEPHHEVPENHPPTVTTNPPPPVSPPEPPVPPGKPTLGRHPSSRTKSPAAKFTFASASAQRFECRLDRGKFGTCRSPKVYDKLKPGRHTFKVRAVGADDKASKAATFSWRVVRGRGRELARG